MLKTKYELVKIYEAINASKFNTEYLKDTDRNYKYITGILFNHYGGGGDTIRIGVESTTTNKIFNPVPYGVLEYNTLLKAEKDPFFPVCIPANGDVIRVIVEGNTVTKEFEGDIVFRYENEPRECNVLNFHHKQLTVPINTTNWESSEVILPSQYKKIKGVWISTLDNHRVGIKVKGEYILNPLPAYMLRADESGPYLNRFFAMDAICPAALNIEIESRALVVATTFNVVFLLGND